MDKPELMAEVIVGSGWEELMARNTYNTVVNSNTRRLPYRLSTGSLGGPRPGMEGSRDRHTLIHTYTLVAHIHTRTHTHSHTHTLAHTHTRTHTHSHTYTLAHIHTRTHTHSHTYTLAHIHTRTHTQEKTDRDNRRKLGQE